MYELVDDKRRVIFVFTNEKIARKALRDLKDQYQGLRIITRWFGEIDLDFDDSFIIRDEKSYKDLLDTGMTSERKTALREYNTLSSRKPTKIMWNYDESIPLLRERLKQSSKKVEITRHIEISCDSLEGIHFDGLSENGHKILFLMAGISSVVSQHVDNGSMKDLIDLKRSIGGDCLRPPMLPEPFTKHFLVDPILTALGYTSVLPERYIEKDIKNSRNHVDYSTVVKPHRTEILIEVEPLGEDLDKENDGIGQVIKYMDAINKKSIGIATDGVKWVLIAKKDGFDKETKEFDLAQVYIPLTKYLNSTKRHLEIDNLGILDEFWETFSSETIFTAHSKLEKDLKPETKKRKAKSNQRKK